MHALVQTIAFRGIDTIPVDVQVHIANGLPTIAIVGLADKAVAESRERVRAALSSIGLALPPKRIAVNLAPADVVKEGAHFDLPIALGLLIAMGVVSPDAIADRVVLGELALDGSIQQVSGVLPAALAAAASGQHLICPAACGPEVAWASGLDIIAAPDLVSLLNHLKGVQILSPPEPKYLSVDRNYTDMSDLKGQDTARRVLEIAAAAGHNLLMIGPPGAGKSMLAARLGGLLPALSAAEALQVTMLHSVAGQLGDGGLIRTRPFREPYHSASMAALVGGGPRAKPGEISLAHNGVLFLDELAEFARPVLDSLRQPLETGKVVVARANHNVTYPARFQLVAAMNPCRCGYLGDSAHACGSAPACGRRYAARVSGPMTDRFDLIIEVPEVTADMLLAPTANEPSHVIAQRVEAARAYAATRHNQGADCVNARLQPDQLADIINFDEDAALLLKTAVEQSHLSARAYHKIQRVARTIADLNAEAIISRATIAEALAYRAMPLLA
jgi:magnesium chelatase family protein